MLFKNIKGITAIISLSLLIVVSLIGYFIISNDTLFVVDSLKVDLQKKELTRSLEILKVENQSLEIYNEYSNNLILNKIQIGGKDCLIFDEVLSIGTNIIDIGSCTFDLNELGVVEIVLFTNGGIFSEYEILRSASDSPFIVSFQSGACNFAGGYIRLYGLSGIDNAHAEVSSSTDYTYNVCIKYEGYTLGTSQTGTYLDLFYLNNESNSAVFMNKTEIYEVPSSWYNITISTSEGSLDLVIGGSAPSNLYKCIGKVDRDDIYGSHISDCDSTSFNDTLWLKIE